MSSLLLANATDIQDWADTTDSRFALPSLIERLIRNSVESPDRVQFRTDEGVDLGGWDGIVEVETDDEFVPKGKSGWELTTSGSGKKSSADDNYEKRTDEPVSLSPSDDSFVLVIAQRWGGKDNWEQEKNDEGDWATVEVYDADDLESWLAQNFSVHVRFSKQIGKHPEGVIDGRSFWEEWSQATEPSIPPELLLAGRDDDQKEIYDWIKSEEELLSLKSDFSPEESLALFLSAIHKYPQEEERKDLLDRVVVIQKIGAWDELIDFDGALILVPDEGEWTKEKITKAKQNSHRIMLPKGPQDQIGDALELNRLSRSEATEVLHEIGIDRDQAWQLASLCRRSLTSFRFQRSPSGMDEQPEWSNRQEALDLIPALFAQKWDENKDQDAISKLANESYENFIQNITAWSQQENPPIRRTGDIWYLNSNEFSWRLIGRYLTDHHLEQFEEVATEVLTAQDPKYDLPRDERSSAQIKGYVPSYSYELQEGFAVSLVIMGTLDDELNFQTSGNPRNYVRNIVRQFFQAASNDWKIWASQSQNLQLLAEAAPDEFLRALENDLDNDDPVIANLFQDQDSTLFSSSPHTGLLRALESLAWNENYLTQVAKILAQLAQVVPGGKLLNRPENSLHEIFRLWRPQTSAHLDDRFESLTYLREHFPDIAWNLLLALIPTNNETASPNNKPKWREWVREDAEVVTRDELNEARSEVTDLLISDIGENSQHWIDVLKELRKFPNQQINQLLSRLEELGTSNFDDSERRKIWSKLRDKISWANSYDEDNETYSESVMSSLESLYEQFAPVDFKQRSKWLFQRDPKLIEADQVKDRDHYEEVLREHREDVIEELYDDGGLESILDFASEVEVPLLVGFSLARTDLLEDEIPEFVAEYLNSSNQVLSEVAEGFINYLINKRDEDWYRRFLEEHFSEFTSEQKGIILAKFPFDSSTWEFVEEFDADTRDEYWNNVRAYGDLESEEITYVIQSLLNAKQFLEALRLCSRSIRKEPFPDPQLVIQTLDEGFELLNKGQVDLDSVQAFPDMLKQTFDYLEEANDVATDVVAKLEWAYLGLLIYENWNPKALQQQLSSQPELFVEILTYLCRSESEEPTEEEQARAKQSWHFLRSWRHPPGYDGEKIDEETLMNWVNDARDQLKTEDLLEVGDTYIGKVLSGSPKGEDGVWPHEAVRRVVEEVRSEALEEGIQVGLYNDQGGYTKAVEEGGAQEEKRAEQYAEYASELSSQWPRTARLLNQISSGYQHDSSREHDRANLRQDIRW